MLDAVDAAVEDCDGAAPGGTARAGRSLLARVGSLRVANPLSWHYVDPGALLAEELGIEPAQILVTTTGGNNPQSLVNATALAIGRGEFDVAVIAGADCHYTQAAARRHPDRPLLPWTVQPADTEPPALFGSDRRGTTRSEEEKGLDHPIHVFPLFENALRAESGRTLPEHLAHIGGTLVPVLRRGGRQSLRLDQRADVDRGTDHGHRVQPDGRLPLHQAPDRQPPGRPRCGGHPVLGGGGRGGRRPP